VVLGDVNPHAFTALQEFADKEGLPLTTKIVDAQRLPFTENSFDGVLALELIEHIDSVPDFAREILRVMRPGGLCWVTTPNRLRIFFWGEPHYGIRYLSALPFRMQGFVATRVFGKRYPFPIRRQYMRFSSLSASFNDVGLLCTPRLEDKVGSLVESRTPVSWFAREFLWSGALVRKRQ